MKISLRLAAAAFLLGAVPAAASAQASAPRTGNPAPAAAAPAPVQQELPAAPRTEPLPAAPSTISDPAVATIADGPPSNAQVLESTVARTAPTPSIGQPDGRMGFQDQVTPIGEEAAWFHDVILVPLIVAISLLVLVLLLWVIVRYRRSANPVPSRTTHNTLIEVVWTLVPVLILVAIAVPSIKLLANQYNPPKADLTVKVIGNQWFWTYEYPDHGIELSSNLLPEQADAQPGAKFRGDADGPKMLAVDERMVVPVGATVKLIVTSADVIHAFGVPAFWVKMDAVPGRLNETWFKAEQPGIYFGQCYELCGARHAYMPIAVEVVSQEDFARWVAAKGGTMPGARPANAPVNPDSTQANTMGQRQAAEKAGEGEGSNDDGLQPTNQVQATQQQRPVLERTDEAQ